MTVLAAGALVLACVHGVQAASATPTLADYRSTYEREQGKIRTNNASVLTADADYLKTLDALHADFKKQGDFDNIMAVIAERKRFEATRLVPDTPGNLPAAIRKAQADYRAVLAHLETERDRQSAKLSASYVKALKELIKVYLAEDKMAEADVVNREMKRVEAELAASGSPAEPRASSGSRVAATGGIATNYSLGGTRYTAWIFTDSAESGTFTVSDGSLACEVLVVAGGGAGGGYAGGGGGGGGVIHATTNVTPGTIRVVVGQGGTSRNGGNSSFGSLVAIGGGSGSSGGDATYRTASSGGSGGGGASTAGPYLQPGAGMAGQGYAGGASPGRSGNYASGGGGGAGAAGGRPTTQTAPGGKGGAGVLHSISGAPVFYGGGGGGATANNAGGNTPGTGGKGGGGDGALHNWAEGAVLKSATAGTANTGGGGGGGGCAAGMDVPSSGGSGIVIVRYVSP